MANPVSFQTAIDKYVPYHRVSAWMLAQKLGMKAPVSLRTMDGQLSGIPTTKSFSQAIVTPSGTPLSGSVPLTISSDGTYTVEFINHRTLRECWLVLHSI